MRKLRKEKLASMLNYPHLFISVKYLPQTEFSSGFVDSLSQGEKKKKKFFDIK